MAASKTRIHRPQEERHPLKMLAGVSLCLTSLYLFLCLITYNQADPSLNRATSGIVANAGGHLGALLSDLTLQLLGLASILMVIVPGCWGVKIVRNQPITFMWVRFSLLFVSLVFAAAMLSLVEPPLSWPITSGFGGSIGAVIHDLCYKLFKVKLITTILTSMTLVMITLSIGMSWSEWKSFGRAIRHAALYMSGLVLTIIHHRRIAANAAEEENYDDDDYEYDDDKPSLLQRLMFWRKSEEYAEYEEEEEAEIEINNNDIESKDEEDEENKDTEEGNEEGEE